MATSGSYDWNITRTDIITAALRKVGALGDWETVTAQQLTHGSNALNAIVKAWHAKGMPVWAINTMTVLASTLSTGTLNIGLGQTNTTPKPLKVIQAFLRIGDNDRPVEIYDRQNFNSLVNHSITGAPNIIHYQPLLNHGVLRCYPIPDTYHQANASFILSYQATFQDMDSASDNLDFPTEYNMAIIYALAVALAPEYGLSVNDRNLLKGEAKEHAEEALSFSTEEGSIYFQPA